jgi:hypothetical protein
VNAISVSCANSCRLWLADGFGPATEGLATQAGGSGRSRSSPTAGLLLFVCSHFSFFMFF